ncbi:MAG: class I SAM-dependent rRNA methyltransferase [Candidatus Brocadiaceae bacterium]|nr:class I SAM-dependent rRNA methyltransferase [Candidatus Brocadiaceae bacterium]
MEESLQKAIFKAWSFRKIYLKHTYTDVYRLVNSYGDNLPEVTIDVYGKQVLVQYFKPYVKREKELITRTIKEIVSPETITEKSRFKGKEIESTSITGPIIPEKFTVKENNVSFEISFREGGGTGLFLDQRDNRMRIKELGRNREVLNCFCYTSSFSVYASLGGALKTTNIDLSKKAIEWSKRNFSLNHIDFNAHEFIVGDVWDRINLFFKKGRAFDLIIIDPPSFSTSKKKAFAVEKNFPEIIGMGMNILRENGVLVFSTNLAKMNLSKFFQLLGKAKNFTSKPYKLINLSSQGIDFPVDGIHFKEPYLKCIMLTC